MLPSFSVKSIFRLFLFLLAANSSSTLDLRCPNGHARFPTPFFFAIYCVLPRAAPHCLWCSPASKLLDKPGSELSSPIGTPFILPFKAPTPFLFRIAQEN